MTSLCKRNTKTQNEKKNHKKKIIFKNKYIFKNLSSFLTHKRGFNSVKFL